ncbi:PASTA domain-containing protein [Gryllotalpicola reticulitermitis]|uniref:PASTA domain-containing protein n=1 Tax=Gryllotalpicola reticulitermitis TaxID=1184153 RepID=A0ABV8Q5K5_9MICO
MTVLVSAGPEHAVVPPLAGATLVQARQRLTAAGLKLGAPTTQDGPQQPGTIINQKPAAEASVIAGSYVDVAAASGWQKIPAGLVGEDSATVVKTLNNGGFTVHTVPAPSTLYATGYVLSVSPLPGQRTQLATVITVTAAQYASPAAPNAASNASATPTSTPTAQASASPTHIPTPDRTP